MSEVTNVISSKKQIIITVSVAAAAFLAALPIGAAILNDSAGAEGATSSLTRTVSELGSCTGEAVTDTDSTPATSAVTKTVYTNTHTHTQNSSNNSGSTAQVGRDGIATAVTVGDVLSNNLNGNLSNNEVSVPVLSNNTTTVSPTVSLLSGNSLLNSNSGSLVADLGLLGL